MCHAHGVHSSAAKNDINVSGTTDKASYEPGETVSVTVSGGYRPTRARAVLYDQNGTQLAVSAGTLSFGEGPVNAPPWPVTLHSPAPATPGTYTWRVAWYGNRYDAGSATFGAGWVADSGNANHGWEIVSVGSFTVNGGPDTDGDGVGDSVDDFQDNPSKATPPAATGTGKITVDATPNELSNVAALSDNVVNQTNRPPGYEFPHGLVTFQVAVTNPGDNAVVTLTFPSTIPEGAKYYKVGAGGFSEFPSAVIAGDTVTLVLTDGGNGDNDGTANGTIDHIGGIATPIPLPSSGGGGGGGGCYVKDVSGKGDAGAVLGSLALLAMFAALRRRKAKAGR